MLNSPTQTMMSLRYLLTVLFLFASTTTLAWSQTWSTEHTNSEQLLGFSYAMAIDGDHILATRTGESYMFPTPPSQEGGVFTFTKTDAGWTLVDELIPEDVTLTDLFGKAMAHSGDLLAVSAPGAMEGCGSVFIFERADQESSWNQQARLDADNCDQTTGMGTSLVLDDEVLYVSAPGSGDIKGQVFRFEQVDNSWQLTQTYSAGEAGDGFGIGLLVDGPAILIGAPMHDENAGLVHLFQTNSGEALEPISNPDSTAKFFGLKLSKHQNTLAISAPGVAPIGMNAPFSSGSLFLYEAAESEWSLAHTLKPEQPEGQSPFTTFGFGMDVEFRDSEVWVSVPFGGNGSGAVNIYDLNQEAEEWTIKQSLSTRPLASFSSFGFQFEVSDQLAVVGIARADFGEGRGVVFEMEGDTWIESNAISDNGRGLERIVDEEVQCIEGKAGEFDCGDVDLLSFLPINEVGGGRGIIVNDVWGWTDTETEKEYAIVGRSNGTSFIDVTNPTNPVFVADLPATEGSNPNAWRDVKTYKNYAFVVADNVGKHGMQIYDMHQLRDIEDMPATVEASVVYEEIYSAHNVIINEDTGFAYIVAASGGGETCGGGYHMVDVNDPMNPTFSGCFSDPSSGAGGNHIHDAQCVLYDGPDQDYQGNEICFGANASVFSIADVSDKENPVTVSALDYPNVAYVHQGWLTDDKKYFYINDEGDEVGGLTEATRTLIWDVEDLDDPIFLKAHLGTTQASDHNFYVKDNLMYQSNYVSGLQILDVSDPTNPKQVAHFDTFPWGDNAPGFAGSWSNYPYFKSGTIVVSSITEGLFLVKKQPEQLP